MDLSRGAIHFRRLFSLGQLAIGNCEPFTDRIIRKFLEIGEGVAARWIEMPQGILLLQMAPGQPDSGAIYLYDRQAQVFYMVGFDGSEDNLTVEEFNQLLSEYKLIRYAEQPSLIHTPISTEHGVASPTPATTEHTEPTQVQGVMFLNSNLFVAIPDAIPQPMTTPSRCRSMYHSLRHVWFQRVGSA